MCVSDVFICVGMCCRKPHLGVGIGRASAVTYVLRLHAKGATTTTSQSLLPDDVTTEPSFHDIDYPKCQPGNSSASSSLDSGNSRPTRASQLDHKLLCCTQRQPLAHLEPVSLGVHVANIDSAFVAEQELFTLPVGVDAHVVLVTLFVGNEWLHDEGVEDARHNFHLNQAQPPAGCVSLGHTVSSAHDRPFIRSQL